jgi:hypothetical protein
MRIMHANKRQTNIKWVLSVFWEGVEFTLTVETEDGIVLGDERSNVATSYLTYFNECPIDTRKNHFYQFKKYIENKIANNNL